MPKWQRIIWGVFYLFLLPIPLLYFYWDNILAIIGSAFLFYLAYYIFFREPVK